MENDQLNEKQLFGMLCDQVLEKHFQDQSDFEVMDCRCRPSHFKKISQIIGYPVKGKVLFPKKWLIAILAAALIFLAGCTVLIYGEQIKGLTTEFFEEYARVTTDNGQEISKINDTYYLGYVPEGFSKVSEEHLPSRICSYYENQEGLAIILFQYSNVLTRIDSEDAEIESLSLGDRTVLCRCASDICIYMWNENGYFMKLIITDNLPEEELMSIIENIKF